MNLLRSTYKMFVILFLLVMVIGCAPEDKQSELNLPVANNECRPWTYWWWMGSAVDKENLSQLLETYNEAGIGGVHVIPIYGAEGYEDKFIDYLSPEWLEMLEFTVAKAEELGMGVDMSTGTGWPFGGPTVTVEDQDARVVIDTFRIEKGTKLDKIFDKPLQALMAYSDKGEIVDLTGKVGNDSILDWVAPDGIWDLYAVSQRFSGRDVKRAAPGGEGDAVNPFSGRALMNYLPIFDKAFADYQGEMVRSFYHDSFEYGGDWSDDLFDEFKIRRGYDLRKHLPALLGRGADDYVARIKSDYHETKSDLLLENFIKPWVKWSHEKGCITRNQAHGSPGNLLDLYAAADIPETEIFGPTGFEIPGLRTNQEFHSIFHNTPPNPLMIKFSSSAAHVTGKKLVSSESCTWLDEHFQVSLSQAKPEIDQLLVSGVNHVFYHGMAYSPADAEWPGWLFYASTNFAPSNSFWRHFPELNAYISRCQSVLQSGKSVNDILLYFPIYDVWHNKEGMRLGLQVHNLDKWLFNTPFHEVAKTMWNRGFTFDYISDRQLTDAKVAGKSIMMNDSEYSVIVVPDCNIIPVKTLENLKELAKNGSTIIVLKDLPRDVPGFGDLEIRREQFRNTLAELKPVDTDLPGVRQADFGKGRFLIGANIEEMLALADVFREPVVDAGINFIRRAHKGGYYYFMSNPGKQTLDGWVTLGVKAKSAKLFDPRSSRSGIADLQEGEEGATQIYLQLQPGESCILQTFTNKKINGFDWKYVHITGEPYEIQGEWSVGFIEGAPVLPSGFETEQLSSWTEFGDSKTKNFSGTAKYSITFDKPEQEADGWLLDLGKVCESASISVNGQLLGVLWSFPFRIDIGETLREGENILEIEVTNLSANRIAEVDRKKVPWKKFYDINFVNISYLPFDASGWKPMDSGLIGPVNLIPCSYQK
ncbi:MAG: glycosyl hydrolase family 2 [Bacteroidales bacterium]|nr:glycosyl hydrolase family 2 [Bacteroidales bacterium]